MDEGSQDGAADDAAGGQPDEAADAVSRDGVEQMIASALAMYPTTQATGLKADQNGDYAVWSRGKLSVSTGGADDELLFEIDPATGRTRAWTSLAVDGGATIAGMLSAEAVQTLGALEAREVAATRVEAGQGTVKALETGELAAQRLDVDESRMRTIDVASAAIGQAAGAVAQFTQAVFGQVQAQEATAEQIVGQTAQLDAAEVGTLSAQGATATTLTADYAQLAKIAAQSAELQDIAATTAHVGSAAVESLTVDTMQAGAVTAASVDAHDVSAQTLGAQNATLQNVEAQTLQAGTVAATLQTLAVSTACGGIATMPAAEADGAVGAADGQLPEVLITVPLGTDAVFVSPCASDDPQLCVWQATPVDQTTWAITRRFDSQTMQAIADGTVSPGQASAFWLAVDFA